MSEINCEGCAGRFYGQDDGSGHRAALLSGPPGIGKTTTATLVCKVSVETHLSVPVVCTYLLCGTSVNTCCL